MIRVVAAYQTVDRREHKSFEDAVTHARVLELRRMLNEIYVPASAIDGLADLVAENFPKIKTIMERDYATDMITDARLTVEEKEIAKVVDDDAPVVARDAYGLALTVGDWVAPKAEVKIDPTWQDRWPARIDRITSVGRIQFEPLDVDSPDWNPAVFLKSKAPAAA